MINIQTFFKNHFSAKEISDNKLKQFTEVHLQRLTAKNTSGQYTALITTTVNAYTAYFGAITDEDTNFAVQQGLTISVKKIIAEFKRTVSQKEGSIRSTWGISSQEYQEFFPLGLNEYWETSLSNIETLMTRFASAAAAHQADLGAAFVNLFNDYKMNFTIARSAQLLKMGHVADAKTLTAQNRKILEIQLMKNINTLATEFAGNLDEGMDFFNQTIIKYNGKKKTETPVN